MNGRSGRWMMKKLFKKIIAIPHLFGKLIVLWCVLVGTGASAWALRILSHTGHDPAALLGVILGFFGGELLVLCLKTIIKKEKVSDLDTEGGTYENLSEEVDQS